MKPDEVNAACGAGITFEAEHEYFEDDLAEVWEYCMANIRKLQSVVVKVDIEFDDRMACMSLIRDYAESLTSMYACFQEDTDDDE